MNNPRQPMVASAQRINYMRTVSTYDDCPLLRQYRDAAIVLYHELCDGESVTQNKGLAGYIDTPGTLYHNVPAPSNQIVSGVYSYDLQTFCFQFPEHMDHVFGLIQTYKNRYQALIEGVYTYARVIYIHAGTTCNLFFDDLCGKATVEKYVIIVGEYATVRLQHRGVLSGGALNMKAITFVLYRGAHVRCYYVEAAVNMQVTFLSVFLSQEAMFEHYCWAAVVQEAYYDVNLYLSGRHAQVDMRVGFKVNANQRIDITTAQYHQVSDVRSMIKVRGIIYESAASSYVGIIKVDPLAINTVAHMEHKTIMHGDNARVSSVPSLEVLTDQVSCMHGTAMGSVDKQQLLYLQSRGIAYFDAEKFLIQGFLNEIGITEELSLGS